MTRMITPEVIAEKRKVDVALKKATGESGSLSTRGE